ncbi:hypothetical protein H5J22_01615 [Cetobacterium sp. 8H]|uniref:hypothetical protein n=1 Tax=Cetobacterium sp. 8H TaxID=2759681 RepID=UPI00163C996A|nr:hypothetical protein [Cetobacterium sp. 8H]MBC2850161.1 hypothetical protein [Cetobacterium sp. 8H]
MNKKIVYIILGLAVAINMYARGLKSDTAEDKQFSLKNSTIVKTTEIFNYLNKNSELKPITEENLSDVSNQNVSFIINKMR